VDLCERTIPVAYLLKRQLRLLKGVGGPLFSTRKTLFSTKTLQVNVGHAACVAAHFRKALDNDNSALCRLLSTHLTPLLSRLKLRKLRAAKEYLRTIKTIKGGAGLGWAY
jgi:hypothetical protein